MMQSAGRLGIHGVQSLQDLGDPRLPLGRRLRTRHQLGRRGPLGFCHTHIIVARPFVFIIAATVLAFGGCLWGSFHFDDYSLFTVHGLAMQTRPLLYATFWLNLKLNGQNPLFWHAFNLALHLAAVVVLRIVLGRLIPAPAALIAAAIFALHPFVAEPVNYVFARGTLLCTVLCLASLNDWARRHYSRAVPC